LRDSNSTFINSFESRNGKMSKPGITFDRLRQLFLDLDFTETVVPKSHIGFRHARSDTEIILPIYKSNQIVAPHHLLTVRVMLEGKGLMDGEQFDRLAESASARQPAS
jgi:hypothetical protein